MWPQTPSGRLAIAAGTLAMRSRMCHLDRQGPRGRFGWLCVTDNGGKPGVHLFTKGELLVLANLSGELG